MRTTGICFGTSTLQAVVLDGNEHSAGIIESIRIIHDGDPKTAFFTLLDRIEVSASDRIAITGRSFRNSVALTTITEPHAVELALAAYYRERQFPDAVISSGGETQLVYRLTSKGRIAGVHSGNKCASGSGEFFLQQIRRLGMSIEEAIALATTGTPSKIAGRCSVFCKSDCTHKLNKGEPRKDVVAGLCRMMADKIGDLVKDASVNHVAFIGGGSLNPALVAMLGDRFTMIDTPEPSACFEAFGAALYARENTCLPIPSRDSIVTKSDVSFGEHAPLAKSISLVEFRTAQVGTLVQGDSCVLGLDVGSTTTKAVLLRNNDLSMVASVYLRTSGDPVQASRNCYRALREQIDGKEIVLTGIGVTGSGRQIAALHALSDDIINEIIAHASAAAFYDKTVDTIFEIGGQDAKYTYLTSGIPSDYAMNEACSAGTGSFLEESARESLNVATEEIGDLALLGLHPANFTDQCAAFIGSDIKRAGQEGIDRNDILAGLVYSICLNYLNRVKGARPVGRKIFMQGGVCYNRAIPLAMASLMNCQIIVPPNPGLMGAFGAALDVAEKIKNNPDAAKSYNLDTLINRTAERESSFTCAGGSEKCDRKCTISRLRLDGKIHPFGGACNKYYNDRLQQDVDTGTMDLVALREHLLFHEYGIETMDGATSERPKIGIMRSFLTHTLYPLYSHFFDRLGFEILLSDAKDTEGTAFTESAFCLPAEVAHSSFYNLVKQRPGYIFLPHVMQLPVKNVPTYSRTCVFVQGEPYYLKTTFRKAIEDAHITILQPVLKMDTTYEAGKTAILEMAVKMGKTEKEAADAFGFACDKQRAFEDRLLDEGRKALDEISRKSGTVAVVIFGRPYNSLTGDTNMGIPHKIASRGIMAIPFDMLPASEYQVNKKMFWAMGQKIMKASQFVKDTPALFGCFITNFSCGPDSFVINFFRNVMGDKPSLTLELDQHTADAGIDTRIEAALEIMRTFNRRQPEPVKISTFRQAKVEFDGAIQIITSHGRKLPLNHPDVEIVFPSMGKFATEGLAAVMRSVGINAKALPISDDGILAEGRSCTTCKECLPYILTTGSFMKYIRERKDSWKMTLFFMATGGGPCRLGQYCVALDQLIERNQIENAAVLTITDENGYGGFGSKILLRSWQSIVTADAFADMRSTLTVAAENPVLALDEMEHAWKDLLLWFEGKLSVRFSSMVSTIALRLKKIPLKKNISTIPVISLIGEIYVRRDEFSRKNIIDYLEKNGFMVRVAPVAEYLCYSNYVVNSGLGERQFTLQEKLRMQLVAKIQEWWESRIKSIFAQTGLYHYEMIEVDKTIEGVNHLMNKNMRGETILTLGLGMREILHDSCGIVSIGPFGCMPSRIAESMLKKELTPEGKARMPGWEKKALRFADAGSFPFLSVETDGSPFPQLVEANLEAFVLQARWLHGEMMKVRGEREKHRRFSHLPVRFFELMTGKSVVKR